MPSYQIWFVGGGPLNRPPQVVVCVDDHEAVHWAVGQLAHHLGAEIFNDGRKVGWVTTANNRVGASGWSLLAARSAQQQTATGGCCGIRSKAAANSDAFQPLIPTEASHRYRSKPATV